MTWQDHLAIGESRQSLSARSLQTPQGLASEAGGHTRLLHTMQLLTTGYRLLRIGQTGTIGRIGRLGSLGKLRKVGKVRKLQKPRKVGRLGSIGRACVPRIVFLKSTQGPDCKGKISSYIIFIKYEKLTHYCELGC